ncbi:MAG: dockerin type I domain-containing protein [Acutalibacteraceae bacterium]
MKKIICLILSIVIMLSVSFTGASVLGAEIMFGDVNDDGVVNMKDMHLLRQRIAKVVGNSAINRDNADINGDGTINAVDASKLRKHLAKVEVLEASSTFTMDSMTDCMNLVGRAVMEESSILLSQTASGFKFTANCSGDIILYLTTAGNAKVDVIVDDDYKNVTTIDVNAQKQKYQAELGLKSGEHTITVLKATEWSQNNLVTINKITIFGEKGTEKPQEKPLKIEFYGDSITSGYGNLTYNGQTSAGEWTWQDGGQTYATFVSNILNADFAVASASGHGVLGNYSKLGVGTYKNYFDYSIVKSTSDLSQNTKWSVTDYDADLIVINFGTNDYSRDRENINTEDFELECSSIIENMHEANPDAEILWVIGMNSVPQNAKIVQSLKTLAENYTYLNFYHSAARQSGGDSHPNIENHWELAGYLSDYIKETYPQFFETDAN